MVEQPPAAIPSAQEQTELPTYGTRVWISYKIDIRTRLGSSLRSVARFLRIMPQLSHNLFEEFKGLEEEKTRFSDVLAYYYFLSSLYKSAATYSLDRNRWRVTTISTYKSTGLFEHECLVAKVECEGAKVYLRFERKRSNKSRTTSSTGKASKSTQKTQASDDSDPSSDDPHEGTRPADGSSSSKRAEDAITFSKTLKNLIRTSECLEIVQFPEGKGLTLSQIAVLARCVNSMGETYSLFKANCYWFARLVVGTAKLIKTDFTVDVKSKRKTGEWKNLPLLPFKSEPEMIEKVKLEYDKLWDAFNDDIYKSVNNENSEIYQEERRKRQEEERKREEAERLEKEERSKREESDRKREGAERLEQEERRKREGAERLEQEERRKREGAERLEQEERRKREGAERLEQEERRKREEEERKREEAERKHGEAEEEIKKLRAQLAAAQASNGTNSSS